MKQQIRIKSTDPNDTPAEIEDKLEKALSSIQLQRERKNFDDVYLKHKKAVSDKTVKSVFNNMIQEIAEVLK